MHLLIALLVVLLVLSIVGWIINSLPIQPLFKQIGMAVLAIIALIWLLQALSGTHVLAL